MASIKTRVEDLKKGISQLKKTREEYNSQIAELDNLKSELEGVWTSPAATKFIDSIRFRKRILELNIEIIDDILEAAQNRIELIQRRSILMFIL